MSTGTVTVHILMIDHRHGTNTSVFTTANQADAALRDWVEQYWDLEISSGAPMPDDPEQAREEYFLAAGGSPTASVRPS